MNLKQLKDYIESFPDGTKFSYSLSNPFSWRGSYGDVAFDFLDAPSTKEGLLEKIQLAYTEEFTGYKGGEYRYGDHTDIHFEEDSSRYTDGEYCAGWIAKLTSDDPIYVQEERLVRLAFKK